MPEQHAMTEAEYAAAIPECCSRETNSSLKKRNNELEDSGTNLVMLNNKLQAQLDRLEFVAVEHYHNEYFGKKWFQQKTGYSKKETNICFAAMNEMFLIRNVELIVGKGDRTSEEMIETRFKIYITARDALRKEAE